MAIATWRAQNSFSGGVISEKMFGRVTLEQYQDSVAKLINMKAMPHGGVTRRSGTVYGWTCKDQVNPVRVIAFEYSSNLSYVLEFGAGYIRFGKDGSLVVDGSGDPIELVTDYTADEVMQLKFVQLADIMWIVHENHRPVKLIRYSDTEWYLDPVAFIDGPYLQVNTSNVTLVASAASGSVTLTAANGAAIISAVNDLRTGLASGMPVFIPVIVFTTDVSHGLTSGETITISGVTGLTDLNGTWEVTVETKTTAYVKKLSTQTYTGPSGVISPKVFVSTDVGRLIRIWDSSASAWGWGEITAYSSPSSVTATVVENTFPVLAETLWRLGKFSDTTGWPGAVMLYEQRIFYASCPASKQSFDGSQVDKLDWFQTAADETLLATDAIGWTLFSQKVDNIAWLIPGRGGLAVGTSGGCWIITGAGGKDDPLTPNSINAKKHAAIGVDSLVRPVAIDNAVIFVDKASRRIHEFAYLWQEDSFRAPDLTILADHLLIDTTVADMDVQGTEKIIWVVMGDGRLIGLTYLRAENIVAWHEHITGATLGGDGAFESVCCATEVRDEVPYFVVRREIDGSTVKYVEYLEPSWDSNDVTLSVFLDSSVKFTNSPASATVSGLDHLEGETVWALADGKVCTGLTVAAGEVTLPFDAEEGCVGLMFFSDVETLPIELANEASGSTVGRVKDIGKTNLRVTKSHGCKMGRTFDSLDEVLFNEETVFDAAPALFSGEKTLDKLEGQPSTDVRVCIRQDLPLPLTINSLVTRLLITED